jgi:DNA-binding transcriptional MerR regulator
MIIEGIEYSRFSDLNIDVNTHQLKIWREKGLVRYIKIGNQLYLYSKDDVEKLKNNLRNYKKTQKED